MKPISIELIDGRLGKNLKGRAFPWESIKSIRHLPSSFVLFSNQWFTYEIINSNWFTFSFQYYNEKWFVNRIIWFNQIIKEITEKFK